MSVGGFLGMGERNVAISPAWMVLSEQRDGSVGLVVNTTKDELKKAEAFNFADVDKTGPDAGKTGGVSTRPTGDGSRGAWLLRRASRPAAAIGDFRAEVRVYFLLVALVAGVFGFTSVAAGTRPSPSFFSPAKSSSDPGA